MEKFVDVLSQAVFSNFFYFQLSELGSAIKYEESMIGATAVKRRLIERRLLSIEEDFYGEALCGVSSVGRLEAPR